MEDWYQHTVYFYCFGAPVTTCVRVRARVCICAFDFSPKLQFEIIRSLNLGRREEGHVLFNNALNTFYLG